jgi:Co/Zn/Cd efflux system component
MMLIDWRDRFQIIGAFVTSIIVVLFFGGICGALFFFTIPQEMKEMAMLLLGILGAGFTQVIGYWLGSSSSSQKKDAVLAAQAATAQTAVVDTAKAAALKV